MQATLKNEEITSELAQAVVDAAAKKAGELDTKMNIAVVDAGLNLKAFLRMDGAWLGSIDIAIKKACTSRSFDMPTGELGKLSQPGGARVKPEPHSERIKRRKASRHERQQLQLESDAEIFEIVRVRLVAEHRASRETMLVPCDIAPTLQQHSGKLPNSLYPYYQRQFGTMVLRAEEYIAAVTATKVVSDALQIPIGAPVLEVTRTAHDIADRVVELRVSQFRSDLFNYNVSLR